MRSLQEEDENSVSRFWSSLWDFWLQSIYHYLLDWIVSQTEASQVAAKPSIQTEERLSSQSQTGAAGLLILII